MAGSLKDVEVVERDTDGRATGERDDASVRTIRWRMTFAYDPPTSITWAQERGDVKAMNS